MPSHDTHWMRRALRLARFDRGTTWPNPAVAACLVRDGRLVAEASHPGAGHPHAEVMVLERARAEARGAVLYVTLEPCNHVGRTPPCTRAILEAGVARVVFAIEDSNPNVAGGGAGVLRAAGVQVDAGTLRGAAWELNHPFFETEGARVPHVTLKLALSADGRLARRAGRIEAAELRRITGERAQRRVHGMRARASCVLVGRGTAAADRPRLSARGFSGGRQPRPVVLDGRLRLEPDELPAGALVLAGPDAPGEREAALAARGFEIQRCDTGQDGRLEWAAVLDQLAARRLGVVLVEGGVQVAGSLLAAAIPHRVHLFCAPSWLGGDGPALSSYPGPEQRYQTWRVRRLGDDVEWVLRRPGLPSGPTRVGATGGRPTASR